MASKTVLVSSSEIGIKSEPVRRLLEKKLSQNIRFKLVRAGISDFQIVRKRGRIMIECNDAERVAAEAAKVFGVFSAMPAVKTSSDFSITVKAIADYSTRVINENETFAIQARRVGELPYVSKDLEFSGGAAVLARLFGKGIKVNLTEPDKTIYVEAREESAYIYSAILHGPGGLPIGFQGKIMGLVSDCSNSFAASWIMMKRGASIVPITFVSASEKGSGDVDKAFSLLRERVPVKNYAVYYVPLNLRQKEVAEDIGEEAAHVLKRRFMIAVCSKIGEKEHAEGITTGEDFDYSPFLTLNNLRIMDSAASLPVYRPLIALGEEELKEVTKRIDGYTLPDKPVEVDSSGMTLTMETIDEMEKNLKIDSLVNDALNNAERRVLT
jgi:tRNA uracil 4-sulfurtransferase